MVLSLGAFRLYVTKQVYLFHDLDREVCAWEPSGGVHQLGCDHSTLIAVPIHGEPAVALLDASAGTEHDLIRLLCAEALV